MNKTGFIIFFSIALTIYFSLNSYIFIRGLQALPSIRTLKSSYIFIFWFLSLSFVAGRILEKSAITWYGDAITLIGALWLAAMLYFLLFTILFDVIRAVNYFVNVYPDFIKNNYEKSKQIIFLATSLVVFLIVFCGYLNAKNPQIKTVDLVVKKNGTNLKSLNIVAASDIHLGTIISNSRIENIVNKINALNPDIVLLPGDVVDEDVAPVIKNNLGVTLEKIKSRFGTYAITGNHEYIGGVEPAVKYLSQHSLNMLRDSVVLIDNSFYIIGREDLSFNRANHRNRKTIAELISGLDKSKPLILLDHQPFHLEEAEINGIDLQISGHTHNGQLWPFNYITQKIYEMSWGYLKKGETNYYVSCGVGTWGPPVRTGNTPEIVNIKLKFEN